MFELINKVERARERNVMLETAVTAFCLGVVAMAGLTMMLHAYLTSGSAAEFALGMNLLVVHVLFHFTEFAVAAAQRPREAHPEAFMILHSVAYLAANTLSLLEFLIEVFLIPESWKPFSPSASPLAFYLFRLNMGATFVYGVLAVVFYAIRVVAMLQCGANFSLMIEHSKRPEHRLIRTGLYRLLRHPSYFGWFWRAPFSQLMLANPVSLVLHTAVTWVFFKHRIPSEERSLGSPEFFGDEYREYKASTIIGIPFIRT